MPGKKGWWGEEMSPLLGGNVRNSMDDGILAANDSDEAHGRFPQYVAGGKNRDGLQGPFYRQ